MYEHVVCWALSGCDGWYAVPGPAQVTPDRPPPGERAIFTGVAVARAQTGPAVTVLLTGPHSFAASDAPRRRTTAHPSRYAQSITAHEYLQERLREIKLI